MSEEKQEVQVTMYHADRFGGGQMISLKFHVKGQGEYVAGVDDCNFVDFDGAFDQGDSRDLMEELNDLRNVRIERLPKAISAGGQVTEGGGDEEEKRD